MKTRIRSSLKNREPIVLAILTILVYGIHIRWAGLYWDDWPFLWLSQVLGTKAMLAIETHRPISGFLFTSQSAILGTNLGAWQIYVLFLRWLTVYSFWWAFRQLWPNRSIELTLAAFFFLIYPGFTQQYVAVNTSRHLLSLALLLFSFGLTVRALRSNVIEWWLIAIAMILSATTMWSTEYYASLELLRPVLIWLVVQNSGHNRKHNVTRTAVVWSPFFVLISIYLVWRINLSKSANYQISLFDQILTSPIESISHTLKMIMVDISEVFFTAWYKIFQFSSANDYGLIPLIYRWLTVGIIGASICIYLYLLNNKSREITSSSIAWGWQAIAIGSTALLVAGWPVWVVNQLEIGLSFPSDRLTLPMLTGISLLTVGLLVVLFRRRSILILFATVLIGFAAGYHLENGLDYRRDWDLQKDFLWQMHWRIPDLTENTLLLSNEINSRSSDNSLSAAINWIYFNQDTEKNLAGWLFYINLRQEFGELELHRGIPINQSFRGLDFRGSTDQVLVIHFNSPSCLRILDPRFDVLDPTLPKDTIKATDLADITWILTDAEAVMGIPDTILGPQPEPNWCYYYQKAELARQNEDWMEVSRLADLALDMEDSPHHPAELIPYIIGYAHTGRVETAVNLTVRGFSINETFAPLFCEVWDYISTETQLSPDSINSIRELEHRLSCSQW